MRFSLAFGLSLAWFSAFSASAQLKMPTSSSATLQAPPFDPPSAVRQVAPSGLTGPKTGFSAAATSIYSIGDPTDDEQLYLELINRARANPNGEAQLLANIADQTIQATYDFFKVDKPLMISQFASLKIVPPLAMNEKLITAARLHSQDMFNKRYQGHVETNSVGEEMDPAVRLDAQGYNWKAFGENVYAFSKGTIYGHASFEVDWGRGTGGMQTPPGHRINIHDKKYREVGIGILNAFNEPFGPQLVTQEFGSESPDNT